MSKTFEVITPDLKAWIERQHVFFVSTAPLAADGLINCSPKGLDSFRVLAPDLVAYQDLTGSGVETIAHLKENRRIVIMFCAFDGPPKILRLHGQGQVIEPGDAEFSDLENIFPPSMGTRAYIKVNLSRIADSCGYSVPRLSYVEDRDVLDQWFDRKGKEGLVNYRNEKNRRSLDGLRGLEN